MEAAVEGGFALRGLLDPKLWRQSLGLRKGSGVCRCGLARLSEGMRQGGGVGAGVRTLRPDHIPIRMLWMI